MFFNQNHANRIHFTVVLNHSIIFPIKIYFKHHYRKNGMILSVSWGQKCIGQLRSTMLYIETRGHMLYMSLSPPQLVTACIKTSLVLFPKSAFKSWNHRNIYSRKLVRMAFALSKVLISDNVSPRCAEILQKNGITVDTKTKLTKEDLINEIPVSQWQWMIMMQ